MNARDSIRALLEPLGVYAWEQSVQWAELKSIGEALDACRLELEHIAREMNLTTAEDEGLSLISSLLAGTPSATEPEALRAALAALLRIGDGSFTVQAICDNILGCGLPAEVKETSIPGQVTVSFPGIGGIPDHFSHLRPIVEEIIPCHVEILYRFWYLLWERLERRIPSWTALEAQGFTWKNLERFVRD